MSEDKKEGVKTIGDIVEILDKCKGAINEKWADFNKCLDRRDQAEAWKQLVYLLHICGLGLRVCNNFLPLIQKSLESQGYRVDSVEDLIDQVKTKVSENNVLDSKSIKVAHVEEQPKPKKFNKIIIIPSKQNIH